MPQVVVGADDFRSGHDRCGDVRDVALESGQLPGAASDVSSRLGFPPAVLTKRGVRAAFCPSMTSRARFSWAVRVVASRTALLREYAYTARHEPGCAAGSQTGSARRSGLFSFV